MKRQFFLLASTCLACLLCAKSGMAQPVPELATHVDADYGYLENLYKYLHAHPELSFHEKQTAQKIASELESAGYSVTTGVGGHGVVGVLKNGDGSTVMIRTDLDALPVNEETGLPYASKVRTTNEEGVEVSVMHACGHDMHMTCFIGTARMLAKMRERWKGTLVLIGQPAEEKGSGARAMLKDGLYTRFPRPDYALALHMSADLPAGKVGYREGYALANVDMVDLTVRGVGGHGAYPHTTKDPIVLAAQIILALQTIVSREVAPIEPAVVTVGSIHGGTKHNIIPNEVKMQLTLRSYSDKVRNQTIEAIRRISRGLARAAGLPETLLPVLEVRDEYTPSTYNDPELAGRIAKVFQNVLGKENIVHTEPVMGGEDFSQYGRVAPRVPIFIFWLGAVDPQIYAASKKNGTPLPSLHSSQFAPLPEPAIRTGVTAMTAAALHLLQ